MSRSLILLFNHTLTPDQEQDARTHLGVANFVGLPKPISDLWAQIPAELESLAAYLKPVQAWIGRETEPGDFILIQGDFGACYLMVRWAFKMNLVPVYSTTRREAVEEVDTDGGVRITHQFYHKRFRKYGE